MIIANYSNSCASSSTHAHNWTNGLGGEEHVVRLGKMPGKDKKGKGALRELVTREYTIHLHKYVHGIGFKRRAPRAIKAIKKFAEKQMRTRDVRIDTRLNKQVWSNGIRNVPHRIRVRLHRKRNEDDDSANKFYTLVTYVHVDSFKGLETKTVDIDE